MPNEPSDLLLRAAIAIAFVIIGLAVIVIMVGLLRNQLEVTSAAGMLVTAATGILGGLLLRGKGGDGQ